MAQENGNIICACVLIDYHPSILHLGYFDAVAGADEAVDRLICHAMHYARQKGKQRLTIGINGHVSYGVGILLGKTARKISFDSLYNLPYYADYFSHYKRTTLATYEIKIEEHKRNFSRKISNTNLTVRGINMKNFDEEMRDFTALCNETLCETQFYHSVLPCHMGELIGGLKPFLKSENILFCESNCEKIGFLFWHPDFNELFNSGKKTSILSVALRYAFKGKKIMSAKINAVGVKNCQGRARAFYLLMQKMHQHINNRFSRLESTYVLDSTIASKNALINSGFTKLNNYAVFEVDCL